MIPVLYRISLLSAITQLVSSDKVLDDGISESELVARLKLHGVKSITNEDVEEVFNRQYFDAAAEIIKRSHDEGMDFSASVRNSVSAIRARLDNLVKLLDPEYSRPQRVPPAFQWTQNDTAIFILLKYSRRFNAPGAVDVSDFNCTFTDSTLLFSAIGGHSGKRFEYALTLDFFDYIDPDNSSWSVGSVGKVTLTISKERRARWPRLLLSTQKIDNMHYWLEYGEKMDKILRGLPEVENGGRMCVTKDRVYCPTVDKCRGSCEECKGKPALIRESNICAGPPAHSAKQAKFVQSNSARDSIVGSLEVTLRKEFHRFDITKFEVFLSNGSEEKFVGKSVSPIANVTYIDIEALNQVLFVTESVSLVIVPGNDFGLNREKALILNVTSEYLPDECSELEALEFEDNNSVENFLMGWFTYRVPSQLDTATNLSFHFGKDAESRIQKGKSFIGETNITSGIYNISSPVSIPPGATHVLVYPKNSVGESVKRIVGVWKIDIKKRPKGLVRDLEIVPGTNAVKFSRFDPETDLIGYTVRSESVTASRSNKKGSSKKVVKEIEFIPVSNDRWSSIFTSSVSGQKSVYGEEETSATKTNKFLSTNVCVYLKNEAGIARSGACVPLETNVRLPDQEL